MPEPHHLARDLYRLLKEDIHVEASRTGCDQMVVYENVLRIMMCDIYESGFSPAVVRKIAEDMFGVWMKTQAN